MKPIIKVENLSKQYTIGAQQKPYSTLRESLMETVRAPFKSFRRNGGGENEENKFWALRDVNFEVMPGEIVGIIGRNGAGKSTLLKVLSRITEPTKGRLELYGRVGSLLEVGTGFHHELTGRENIFLNGTILGMKRSEITKKFDEIVDFAEIEKFIDTPVKHYSSGMYTRLAFGVAAHLNPEILLVDEVLAVGDANFQKKCLGKMEEVGNQGRTVFFVSHSMPMILRLCKRVILLNKGEIIKDGLPSEATSLYLNSDAGSPAQRIWHNLKEAPGNEVVRLLSIKILDQNFDVSETINIQEPFSVEVEYWDLNGEERPTISLHFVNEEGITLFCTNDFNNKEWWTKPRQKGLVKAVCHIPGNLLAEGRFFLLAAICNYNPNIIHFVERDVVSFQIIDKTVGEGVRGDFAGHWPGVVRPFVNWDMQIQSNIKIPL